MPGPYAHLTLVSLASDSTRLESGLGMPRHGMLALDRWNPFCELGSVSPDFPYLAVGVKTAKKWGDLMHAGKTGAFIRSAIEDVRAANGTRREKSFVWLLGYAAHMIADATIHPVVQLKVGAYTRNKDAHRRCEAHQDAYIFERFETGGLGVGDYLESRLEQCSTADGSIDPSVADLWQGLLSRLHPETYQRNPPDLWRWNKGVTATVEAGNCGDRLFPFGRHVSSNSGLRYPSIEQVDHQSFVSQLKTPHGMRSYDEVFEKTLTHVVEGWQLIGDAVFANGKEYRTAFGEWNLDTGRDASGQLVFW